MHKKINQLCIHSHLALNQTWATTLKPWESYFTSFKVHVVDREFIYCIAYELPQISACLTTPQNVSFSSFIHPHWQPPIFEDCYMPELFTLLLHAWLPIPRMDGMWAAWELAVEFRELGEWFRWRNPGDLFLLLACLCPSDSHQQSDELTAQRSDAPKVRLGKWKKL